MDNKKKGEIATTTVTTFMTVLFICIICGIATMISGCAAPASGTTISTAEKTGFKEYDSKDIIISMPNYNGFVINLGVPEEVTEADQVSYVNELLKSYPQYSSNGKETVEDGDTIMISFTGKLKGETDILADEKNYALKIGSNALIPGFERGLIGKKKGDKVDLALTYPADEGNEKYRGKEVEFNVTINDIVDTKIFTYDTLTDEFIKTSFGDYTKDSFLTSVKSQMYNLISETKKAKLSDIQSAYVEQCTYNVPQDLLDEYAAQFHQQFVLQNCGGDESRYEAVVKEASQMDVDKFEANIKQNLEKEIAFEMACKSIAKTESIDVSDNEIEEYVKNQMTAYNITDKNAFLANFDSSYETGLEYMKKQALKSKILKYISDHATTEYDNATTVTKAVFGINK